MPIHSTSVPSSDTISSVATEPLTHFYQISASARWSVGIVMLTVALFLTVILGQFQENAYLHYGKVWQENMFYTHALSLPMFLIGSGDIIRHIGILINQAPVLILTLGGYPIYWSLFSILIINVFSQYLCLMGVYIVTSNSGTLTCNFAITIRKFVSLIISVFFFNHSFTLSQWIFSGVAFVGVYLYSSIEQELKQKLKQELKQAKEN